ncbi:hypothetical protein ACLB2K_005968 [Fragaria x ananassa]
MATRGSRSEKVKRIFYQFDVNHDGGLNREEMAALVVVVNPRGLTYEGLLRTYDDGAGDVDRDFDALGVELSLDEVKGASMASEASSSSIVDERVGESQKKQRTAAWAVSPNHGIAFDDTWKIVDDLEILVKRLKAKQAGSNGKSPSSSDPSSKCIPKSPKSSPNPTLRSFISLSIVAATSSSSLATEIEKAALRSRHPLRLNDQTPRHPIKIFVFERMLKAVESWWLSGRGLRSSPWWSGGRRRSSWWRSDTAIFDW